MGFRASNGGCGVQLEGLEEAGGGRLAHALIGVRYAQVGQRAHVVGFDFERPVSRNVKSSNTGVRVRGRSAPDVGIYSFVRAGAVGQRCTELVPEAAGGQSHVTHTRSSAVACNPVA